MTPEQLAEIRARAEAATPGPWDVPDGEDESDGVEATADLPEGVCVLTVFGTADAPDDALPNATFVAHARMDIPALLDYIEELQAVLRAVLAEYERVIRASERAKNELQAWANTIRNPATPFRCEEIADGIEAALEKLR